MSYYASTPMVKRELNINIHENAICTSHTVLTIETTGYSLTLHKSHHCRGKSYEIQACKFLEKSQETGNQMLFKDQNPPEIKQN